MNKTKIDPRSAAKKAKDAAFAKIPPAAIASPLQFIWSNTPKVAITSTDGKVLGYEPSPEYKRARVAAYRGNGALVKSIARSVALEA